MFTNSTTRWTAFAVVAAAGAMSIASAAAEPFAFPWTGQFERSFSGHGIALDSDGHVVTEGFVPFDIVTPLFSDYADKVRYVFVPGDASAKYDSDEAFTFPPGSVLVKSFSYPVDARDPSAGRHLVETRLMVRLQDGWTGAAYVWNAERTEARLRVAGAEVPLRWIDAAGRARSVDYWVPDMNQCKLCHGVSGTMRPIGVKARHLNKSFSYPEGEENQLAYWSRKGLLSVSGNLDQAPRATDWTDLQATVEDRTRAYLDINCAQCHNPSGLASHTPLDLSLDQMDPRRRGVLGRPTTAGNSARGRLYAIKPGFPEESILLHRLRSTRPDVRMPPVGRTIAHDEGAALIAEWIQSLSE